mmetsp:Transcript_16138/g.34102  ORF Transcript_16138/g.34102 Transcript_16138/m.34102 type:complete len:278 (-) Transcript_16138:519-1352(-)
MKSSTPQTKNYGATQSNPDTVSSTDNNTPHDDVESTTKTPTASTTSSLLRPKIRRKISQKVPLSSFLWHSHSVLGMTVPDDHIPPPIATGPCPCCVVDPQGLTRRRRLFLFLLVFFVSTTLAVQVSMERHGDFYALCAMVFLVLPLVCHLKENLPTYSRWFMDHRLGPLPRHFPNGKDGMRLEELALCGVYAIGIVELWEHQHEVGIWVLENVLWVWLGTLVGEMGCLVFQYYCGKYCCCCFNCCVPTSYRLVRDVDSDDDDEEEDGEDDNNEGGVV